MTGFEPQTSVLEATTLPTEPQPLPYSKTFVRRLHGHKRLHGLGFK